MSEQTKESVTDLSAEEKADALDDLMGSFREEYFDIEDHWVTIDGGADVSDETVRVLRLLRDQHREPGVEWKVSP